MTITEVWADTPKKEKREIVSAIVVKAQVAFSTAYAWCNGNRRPMALQQRAVADAIRKVTGNTFTPAELYPERTNA